MRRHYIFAIIWCKRTQRLLHNTIQHGNCSQVVHSSFLLILCTPTTVQASTALLIVRSLFPTTSSPGRHTVSWGSDMAVLPYAAGTAFGATTSSQITPTASSS